MVSSHFTRNTGLTKDVGGKAFLKPLSVHIPLTHDGACIVDLHRFTQETIIFLTDILSKVKQKSKMLELTRKKLYNNLITGKHVFQYENR